MSYNLQRQTDRSDHYLLHQNLKKDFCNFCYPLPAKTSCVFKQFSSWFSTICPDILDYLKDHAKDSIILQVDPFADDGFQDLLTWLKRFEKATTANNWIYKRKINVIPAFLQDNTDEWQDAYFRKTTITNYDQTDWEEVVDAFKKRFCTIHWQNQWLRELDNLKQQIGEPVDTYYSKFNRLVKWVKLEIKLQDKQILYYFKKGLCPEIFSVLLLHNSTSLEDMLKYAQIHEQDIDFANNTVPNHLNYATIALVLVAQMEKNIPQISALKLSSKPKEFTCYKCREPGHIAKNCLSEKVETLEPQYNSKKDEVYVMHPQPYITNRKGAKGKQKQSESCKEEALRKKAEIQEQEESSDNNPAAYLADFCEKDKILFNVNKELKKEQFGQAESLLNENTHESEVSVQEILSDMGWESTDDNKPHEIYIKLEDLIRRTEIP
ncbi:749_t:CDS:2, partial [Gigaspora margarita]